MARSPVERPRCRIRKLAVVLVVAVGIALLLQLDVLVPSQLGGSTSFRKANSTVSSESSFKNPGYRDGRSPETIAADPNASTTGKKPAEHGTSMEAQRLRGNDAVRQSIGGDEARISEEEKDDMQSPFWPLHVFHKYKHKHSVSALRTDRDPGRKFAVVTYWCPNRVGNILHNMFNSMVWAMASNRTILWKYDEYWNTVEDCERVLERASWIGGWEEWSKKLDLPSPIPIPIHPGRRVYDQQHKVVMFPQIPDIDANDTAIFRNGWRDDPLRQRDYKDYLYQMGEDVRTDTAMLYDEGVDFLFGMLFRKTFTVKVGKRGADSGIPENRSRTFSVAIHSRHPVVGDDGSFVSDELRCLRRHLELKRSEEDCKVYVISDRPTTVAKLSAWAQRHNCSTVSRDVESDEGKTEHGPWSGVGFIEDVITAGLARTAVVGDRARSSFMLLVELITYDRLLEALRAGEETIEDLELCTLPGKPSEGYDYGPGTPTFRHHTRQAKLRPVQVMEQYKMWHSEQSLQEISEDRKYALVFYTCPHGRDNLLHQLFNDMILAMATNRTMLWRFGDRETCLENQRICSTSDEQSECDEILRVRDWLPSYEDWNSQLTFKGGVVQLDPLAVQANATYRRTDWKEHIREVPELEIVAFPPIPQKVNGQTGAEYMASEWSRRALEKLYSEGVDFLYGMLFEYALELLPVVKSAIPSGLPGSHLPTFSVALQNRHSDKRNNDSNFSDEIRCIISVLRDAPKGEPCHVYIMSDRVDTLSRLSNYLLSRNCTAWVANHTTRSNVEPAEHKPNADLHFFQDYYLLSTHGRSAFVGHAHRSSQLVLEQIVYRNRMEVWKLGRDPPILSNISTCMLPD